MSAAYRTTQNVLATWQKSMSDATNMWSLNTSQRGEGRAMIRLLGGLLCRFAELLVVDTLESKPTAVEKRYSDMLFNYSFSSFQRFRELILDWSELTDPERAGRLSGLVGEMQTAQSELFVTLMASPNREMPSEDKQSHQP